MADLVELRSEAGQLMLKEVFQEGRFNQPYVQGTFSKQIGRASCGVQSCALIMGAAKLGRAKPEVSQPGSTFTPPISEAKMLAFEETLKVTSEDRVSKEGLSLDSVVEILKSHRFEVETYFARSSSIEEFREKAKAALTKGSSETGVIVNYHMRHLGQGMLGGHHSPLGAYHAASDRFLILDTWPDTSECWATAENLFSAMDTLDETTGKSRGFCVVHME